MRKTGFIAIVGLANAGKSTLLNQLVGQKVSIVSPKPQTTRDSILGVWTDDDSQMVFVDTPGFLQSKNALGDYMLRTIDNATQDVDAIVVVVDGHDGISDRELAQINRYADSKLPLVVAVNKIDISQPEKLMPELAKLNEIKGIKEVYCISAKRNRGVEESTLPVRKCTLKRTTLPTARSVTWWVKSFAKRCFLVATTKFRTAWASLSTKCSSSMTVHGT